MGVVVLVGVGAVFVLGACSLSNFPALTFENFGSNFVGLLLFCSVGVSSSFFFFRRLLQQ